MNISKKSIKILDGRDVLITGGTGSVGRKIAEVALKHFNPRRVVIFSRDEMKQSEMRDEEIFKDERLRFFIGDIRDKERLYHALNGVDIVIHTAAMKMIADTEYNPFEAVKTNIHGTQNLIEGCVEQGVLKIISLSHDKAVNPVSLYGGTKFVSEKLFIDGNIYGNNTGVRFSCVRFGEIIGTRSNIIVDLKKQINKNCISITDEKMSRFFITLEQAVDFIISSLNIMVGGEIFVPKVPSFRVLDLIKRISPNIPIEIKSKPGEKNHEMLISTEEANHMYMYDNYFTIFPQYPKWKLGKKGIKEGEICSKDFSFCSNINSESVNYEEVQNYIQNS